MNRLPGGDKRPETALEIRVSWYDYGWRMYDPALGRWHCADPAAELAHNWIPYRYGFNNPILFNDAYGLWEQTANGWTTSDASDISRFINMLQIEEATEGEASIAQVDQFITEEFNGSGGKLSNGSVLLSEATAYGDGQGNWEIPDYQMGRMRSEVSNYSSFAQNHNNFVGKYSFYSYKYYRERSWQQRDGNFPGISLTGYAAGRASSFLATSKTWLNISNMKTYSQYYFGNKYQSSKIIARNKNIANKASGVFGVAGRLLGLVDSYQTLQQYQSGQLTNFGGAYIGANNLMGLSKHPYLGAYSIGTSIGKTIVESNWYFNLVYGDGVW